MMLVCDLLGFKNSKWYCTKTILNQCRRQSIRSRGPKFFIDFSPGKTCVHNAITGTSINNSLMHSEIRLIGVASSKLLFPEHLCNYSNKVLLISARGSEGAL